MRVTEVHTGTETGENEEKSQVRKAKERKAGLWRNF